MALIVDIFVRKVEGQSCGLNELLSQKESAHANWRGRKPFE